MAYVKQNWECGEMITADKLNHMEDGIAAGGESAEPLFLEVVTTRAATQSECGTLGGTVQVMNHTWQEVYDATIASRNIFVRHQESDEEMLEPQYVVRIMRSNIDGYQVVLKGIQDEESYGLIADTENDYLKAVNCNPITP